MKKWLVVFLSLVLILTVCACNSQVGQPAPEEETREDYEHEEDPEEGDISLDDIRVYVNTKPLNLSEIFGKLDEFPEFDPDSPVGIELISTDLRDLDLSNQLEALEYASFDDFTQWPESLPSDFDYGTIMELGKNPGLNIRSLHQKGITGNGIGIAVIDKALLVGHSEFGNRVRHYEQVNYAADSNIASFHGTAVSSIALGDTVGVAPDAQLYHIAVNFGDYENDVFKPDYEWTAKAIDRIIAINKVLSGDEKIRVIAIAHGWEPYENGFPEVMEAIERAKDSNIFVVSSSLSDSYNMAFHGLGRSVYDHPDDYELMSPGLWWESDFWGSNFNLDHFKFAHDVSDVLLIPMDSRTSASPTAEDQYIFLREGGWSFSIPWIAGLYALTCQVDPEITPEQFWEIALQTGDTVELEKDGHLRSLGKIVNPGKIIDEIQTQKNS